MELVLDSLTFRLYLSEKTSERSNTPSISNYCCQNGFHHGKEDLAIVFATNGIAMSYL